MLSNLFSSSSATAGGLFSDAAKEKFARVYKPEEFDLPTKKIPEPIDPNADDGVEPLENPKKKRKERKRKAPDANGESNANVTGTTKDDGAADGKDMTTIFVGNIPVSETVKSLTKFFKTYGEIESIRLRSVPIAGTKVDEAGNQDLVKKVCVNSKKFGEQKGSFNAYIKFKNAESTTASLAANNQLMGNRHIRVDRSSPTLFDPKRSVFLGGLPHYADEEEIREYFSQSLPNGHDDIEGLRIIRDPSTLVGKGIGYLLFRDRDCVLKALALHKAVYKKRWPLRVSACGKRTKRSESAKPSAMNSTEGADGAGDEEGGDAQAEGDTSSDRADKGNSNKRGRVEDGDRRGKRPKGPSVSENAMRRLKHKTVITRNKLLIERKQKKAQKGRHGKRLGGVVKRAMKASKMQK